MASIRELVQPDYEKIKEVLIYSQNIENPKIDKLLTIWANAKQILSNNFLQEKLSYTYPEEITFTLSPEIRQENFDNFIQNIKSYGEKHVCLLVDFLNTIGVNDFYNNSLTYEYVISEKDKKILPKGSKVIKSFKYFITDPTILILVQNSASMYIQENKVSGYLTFSIHPLDFLSSSENTYNWRSCHSLDGEYRAGNLSYICDMGTMIVYLSPNKPEKLPNFPASVLWNSKKWRMLIHFSSGYDVCFASRQYPFASKEALNKIYEIFNDKLNHYKFYSWRNSFGKDEWSGWKRDYITSGITYDNKEIKLHSDDEVCIINNSIYKLQDIIHTGVGACNYNDLLNSTVYDKPFYMYKKYNLSAYPINITVGVWAPCIGCEDCEIEEKDTMLCNECARIDKYENIYCEGCSRKIYPEEEEINYVDGQPLCRTCYENETFICDNCGERHFYNWLVRNDDVETRLCDECYHKRMEEIKNGTRDDSQTEYIG